MTEYERGKMDGLREAAAANESAEAQARAEGWISLGVKNYKPAPLMESRYEMIGWTGMIDVSKPKIEGR